MSDYVSYIKRNTKPVEDINDDFINSFKWLSKEIYGGKAPLKSNSVQFIIIKILDRYGKTYDIQKRDHFDVYVVGEFRKTFTPVLRVAQAFADFYLEFGSMPNIIPIPKLILQQNNDILYKLKNGVLIYERR
ncbi:hypothetical protein GVN16_13815 [Emticicia sp. CRIBPO]|uniref:hypothetical protein n=1 Tax=Emticicia sp. CRIBPO TaxID=2683258 RepID=UPI0014133DE7|nr:hypothetical protein [Emticicia sp. CRIBPO]NBA86847.1 hypothetical protein [Emticicia sp. CRIBPO]